MERYINEYGKISWKDVNEDDILCAELFHDVDCGKDNFDHDKQQAFHSNLGSMTVLDRMTGFGYRDIETGYRSLEGKFWLASGNFDIRKEYGCTIGEAIEYIKENANVCIGVYTW